MTSQADRVAMAQSTLLPLKVRQELQKAAALTDEKERHYAIDEIVDRARRNHPQYFNHNP